jgi:hypothetical protein
MLGQKKERRRGESRDMVGEVGLVLEQREYDGVERVGNS